MRIRGRRVSTTRRNSRTSSGTSRASRWEIARRPSAIAANQLSGRPFVRASAPGGTPRAGARRHDQRPTRPPGRRRPSSARAPSAQRRRRGSRTKRGVGCRGGRDRRSAGRPPSRPPGRSPRVADRRPSAVRRARPPWRTRSRWRGSPAAHCGGTAVPSRSPPGGSRCPAGPRTAARGTRAGSASCARDGPAARRRGHALRPARARGTLPTHREGRQRPPPRRGPRPTALGRPPGDAQPSGASRRARAARAPGSPAGAAQQRGGPAGACRRRTGGACRRCDPGSSGGPPGGSRRPSRVAWRP